MAVTLSLAGCGGGGDGLDDDATAPAGAGATTTTAAPTSLPATTVAGTALTLRITNVALVNSEESDNGMRVLLPAGVATASVTLSGVPTPNRVISVCQASELGRRMNGAACRTAANGEAVNVTLGSAATGVEVVQVGVSGPGPGGNTTSLSEVLIRYSAPTREVEARLPQVASGEAGPTFALSPAGSTGRYRAVMTWGVIAQFGGTPSQGQIELVQGGAVTSQAQSGGEVRLEGTVSPPAEAALRLRNTGTSALVAPKVTALLP